MLKGFTFLKTKEFKVQTWKKIWVSILEVTSWRRGCKPIMPGTILIPLWVSHWWKRHTLRVGQWYLNGTKYKGQQNELSCRPMYISLCMCVIYCTRSPIIMEVENGFQGNYYWKGTHVCLPWLWEEVYVNVFLFFLNMCIFVCVIRCFACADCLLIELFHTVPSDTLRNLMIQFRHNTTSEAKDSQQHNAQTNPTTMKL